MSQPNGAVHVQKPRRGSTFCSCALNAWRLRIEVISPNIFPGMKEARDLIRMRVNA